MEMIFNKYSSLSQIATGKIFNKPIFSLLLIFFLLFPLPVLSQEKQETLPITNSISSSFVNDGRAIQVKWTFPQEITGKFYRFRLYRSFRPITGLEIAQISEEIIDFSNNETEYTDQSPGDGENFYALVTIDENGAMSKAFEREKNYTDRGIIAKKPERMMLDSILDYTYYDFFRRIWAERTHKGIGIYWEWSNYIPSELEETTVYLIRTQDIPLDFTVLRDRGRIIYHFSTKLKRTSFEDIRTSGEGPFYYTLLVSRKENIVMSMEFVDGVNAFSRGITLSGNPVREFRGVAETTEQKPQKQKSIEPESQENISINNILNDYFFHGKYKKAYLALEPFSKSDDPLIKSKALLFQGRCIYEIGLYKRALPFFLDKDVNKYYKKSAMFWKRSIYHRMRNGNRN